MGKKACLKLDLGYDSTMIMDITTKRMSMMTRGGTMVDASLVVMRVDATAVLCTILLQVPFN